MTDETIKKIIDLKARLDSVKEYDQEIAEDIVNEVLCYMIDIYEEDYYDKIPEEDNETISIYAYYKRGLKYSDDADFSMIINGQCYANRPGDTCARNFDVLKSVARSEGMDVRILSKEELLKNCGGYAIGGYIFSIKRLYLEKVIAHPNVLQRKRTIPKTLNAIKNK